MGKKTLSVVVLLGIAGYLSVTQIIHDIKISYNQPVWKQAASEMISEYNLRYYNSPKQARIDMADRTICSNYRFAVKHDKPYLAKHYREKNGFSRGCALQNRLDSTVNAAIADVQENGFSDLALYDWSDRCMVDSRHWYWGADDAVDGNDIDLIMRLHQNHWERENGKEWKNYGCEDDPSTI